jgi:hypothetical protein
MKLYRLGILLLPAACIAGIAFWRTTPVFSIEAKGAAEASAPKAWSEPAAAKYLDEREVWWQSWPRAQKDHGTVCISCHTTVPYAMARPALRPAMHESGAAGPEKVLLDSVERRVDRWGVMVPFYSDAEDGAGKTAESHSTEAVMNAVILTGHDGREGEMRPVTRTALDEAWALQLQTGEDAGGWIWQDFHLSPWESHESSYQGAAMLMLNLGAAPDIFARTPEDKRHLELLEGYLKKHYAAQPMLNQVYVYWAAADSPALLSGSERAGLLAKLLALQQPDGGWRLSSLDMRKRLDKTAQPSVSDGLATALVALALEANAAGRKDASLAWGLAWLEKNQGKDGRWQAYSLNKERDPESNIGKFMSDAATGYAVLALERAK